jgi:2-hydroxy-6-oxonona-2,4-dienedioate hydrolase
MSDRDTVWCDLFGVSFRQTFYDVDGVRVRSIEAGDGPAMVFLHGAGGHAETWARNLAAHAPHRRCYCIDMIGHGFSDAPAEFGYNTLDVLDHVIKFLDVAGIERADFCGESFGGRISLWMALKHPERVNKLVLNTAGGLQPTSPKALADVSDLLARTSASLETGTDDAVRKRIEWLFADPSQVPAEFVKIRQAIYSRPGIKGSLSTLFSHIFTGDELNPWLTPELLSQIQAPTLVIWSDKNPITAWETARDNFSHIPNVQFHLIKDAAHWPQYEQPQEYNRVELDFLACDQTAALA